MIASLRIVVILFVACLASNISRAQSSLIYGHPNADEEGYEVIATNDGGYMIGGHSTDTTTGNVQYWVVKVNGNGAVAWDTVYNLGFDRAFLWSIQPDDHGGALLAGYTGVQNSGTESALVLDIDSVGHITKKFDLDYERADHAHWFAHRKQGGYFWAGHTDSESDASGVMILMRLDENFDSVWQKTYSYHPNSGEHAHCGTLTSDGGCVLAGHTELNGQEHTWAVRVDSNGNEVWKKLFSFTGSTGDSPYGITMTREGNFAIFGGIENNANSSMRVFVVDTNGTKLLDRKYGGNTSWAYDGFQASNGDYVIVGVSQTQTAASLVAVRVDGKGTQKWQKDFNGLGNAWGSAGFQHKDQYVLIGGTQDPNLSQADFYAVYVDTNGNEVAYDTGNTTIKPHGLDFTLDSVTLRFALDGNPHGDTVRGTIKNIGADSTKFIATIPPPFAPNWVVFANVAGKNLSITPDTVAIAPQQSVPVILTIFPYAERADTEHYCLQIQELSEIAAPQEHCVELIVLPPAGAGVEPEIKERVSLWPNPASTYITLTGTSAKERYQIYNAAGMLVQTGATSEQIDIHSLTAGAYEIVINGRAWPFSVVR